MSDKPFLFWYCDMEERAVSPAVRKTIADFLWEKGGEKEKYLNAPNQEESRENFKLEGVKVYIPNVIDIYQKAVHTITERQGEFMPVAEKINKLKSETRSERLQKIAEQARQKSAPAPVIQDTPLPSLKSGFGFFSVFTAKPGTPEATAESTSKPKLK